MLQDLARRIGLGIAAAILIGTGAGTTFVAVAFAIYAALKPLVGPSGASGLTALVAAALTGMGGAVLLGLIKAPAAVAHARKQPLHRGVVAELGVLALGILGDIAAGHRAKREQKTREAKHRHR